MPVLLMLLPLLHCQPPPQLLLLLRVQVQLPM
jgi:hypothetical protein